MKRFLERIFKVKLEKSYMQFLRSSYNKHANILISDNHRKADIDGFFFGEEVLVYPKGTSIGRIFIDIGLAKSWSEVNGTQWKNYQIPDGFSELFLDGFSIQKENMWDTRRNWSGFRPHKISILKWEDD